MVALEQDQENYDETEEISEDEIKEEAKQVFTLKILKIIKDAQQQHGLRHSDFQRYRCYCTRRIRRLRKTLHLAQGDKRHYKRRDVTEAHLKDERFLYIPLMMAERAWSYAMQLRQEANTEPRKKFHMVARLRKAATHAVLLQNLCQSDVCDARTKLEAQAYVAWIQGSLSFELQMWQKAMDYLQQAQMVYSKLCDAVGEDDQSIYKSKEAELLPSLRYCAYNIGDSSAITDLQTMRTTLTSDSHMLDKLDALMEEARGKQSTVEEVEWRGKKMAVKPISVGAFIAAEQELNSPDIDSLDRHLIKCKDAINAVRELINNEQGGKKGVGNQQLLTYLMYIRLTRTIQRTQLMIEAAKQEGDGKKYKAQDLIRLYEMILQNLTEMQQLQDLENDPEFQDNIESDINKYKSYRCFYMCEALKVTKHFKEAYALLERGLVYAGNVKQSEEIKKLIGELETAKYLALAEAALQLETPSSSSGDKKTSNKGDVPLIDRLDEYREDPKLASKTPNLVEFPPDMQPVAYKPLFFDVAVNHLAFPKLDDKVKPQATQQGISGFVKSFWGGWSGGSK